MTTRPQLHIACLLLALALPLAAQTATALKTTDVLVTLTVKPGITRDRITPVMPAEVRATVRLYLDGKIRQWFSRSDGKGVVFILDCKDVAEAQAVMEALPLAKEKLVDYEYTALTPLAPLGALIAPPAAQ
jgi:hypothetical protein